MLEAMRAYVDLNREALQRVHEAGHLTRSRYPIDLTEGMNASASFHLSSLRRLARLLSVELSLRTEQGDAAGATRSTLTLIALAESLRDEPTVISQLVRGSLHAIYLGDLQRALVHMKLTSNQLLSIQTTLLLADDPDMAYRSWISERCMTVDLFYSPTGDLGVMVFGSWPKAAGFVYIATGFRDLDYMAYLDLMGRGEIILKGPTDRMMSEMKKLDH